MLFDHDKLCMRPIEDSPINVFMILMQKAYRLPNVKLVSKQGFQASKSPNAFPKYQDLKTE